jgi:hypothetical protein
MATDSRSVLLTTLSGLSENTIRHIPYEVEFDETGKLAKLEKTEMCNIPTPFDIKTLCAALLHDISTIELRGCLEQYDQQYPGFQVLLSEHATPALYYATAINRVDYIDLLAQFSIDIHKTCAAPRSQNIPLLASTIMNGAEMSIITSEMAAKLLYDGLDPKSIPEDMWIEVPSIPGSFTFRSISAWCTAVIRDQLATALTITHSYLLCRANDLGFPNERTTQIAEGTDMRGILKIGHSITSQRTACERVLDLIFTHKSI